MIYTLVVVYNKKCEDSHAICSLRKRKACENMQCIVYDNSTEEYGNAAFCDKHQFLYYGQGYNVGLSKAYNFVINTLKEKKGFLLILDDDTELTEEFFEELNKIEQDEAPGICVPVVMADTFILSPSMVKFKSGSATIRSVDDLRMDRITAINSGMVVNLNVYDRIHYNEDLFLDCVDHEFMRQARLNSIPIYVMQSSIQQNYSRNERTELSQALKRFYIYKRDFRTYSKECNGMLFYYASILKLRLCNSIKYRTTAFLHG